MSTAAYPGGARLSTYPPRLPHCSRVCQRSLNYLAKLIQRGISASVLYPVTSQSCRPLQQLNSSNPSSSVHDPRQWSSAGYIRLRQSNPHDYALATGFVAFHEVKLSPQPDRSLLPMRDRKLFLPGLRKPSHLEILPEGATAATVKFR
jgi:hypothetical protein